MPRVVGIDDWAYRKGHRYGTLICDLESGRVLDLLPDRDANSLAQWLGKHPSISVISRDRGDVYRKGATMGAPKAIQVADRFHLIKNLRDAFARFLEGQSTQIQQSLVLAQSTPQSNLNWLTEPITKDALAGESSTNQRKINPRAVECCNRRLERYQQVHELFKHGVSIRAIAEKLGIQRFTVRRFLRSKSFPERAKPVRPSKAQNCADYLKQRWDAGCHNAKVLWQEITAKGLKVSISMIRRFVSGWRTKGTGSAKESVRISPNDVSWLMFRKPFKLTTEQTNWKRTILQHCSEINCTWRVVSRFIVMLRKRKGQHLDRWLKLATGPTIAAPIRQFAEGLKSDLLAVQSALKLPWNNGAAEGHINKLKMVKRQMYGRAKFDLVRARILLSSYRQK
jgi:transposase